MGFQWTRCRRCGRSLTNPTAVRDRIGRECAQHRDAHPTRRKRLTAAIDKILDGEYPEETKQVARNEAERMETGRAISIRRTTYLLQTANPPRDASKVLRRDASLPDSRGTP